ncbi:hypothetical protein [Burkholderia ambifaria]|uniref:hypothetical protein n=1 Tax=Burkholderia ambifaria TaxID=152480 RepID=UPI000F7FC215|nr:hypothetical protein [Burkholderia ambifaria]
MNPLATCIGVAYPDMRYRLVREFAERDHHGSMFVAQPFVRGRHLDLTAQGSVLKQESARTMRIWNGPPSRRRSNNALFGSTDEPRTAGQRASEARGARPHYSVRTTPAAP